MRKLVAILFIMTSVGAFAQQPSADFTTVMVDGQVTSSKLEDMNAGNILLIEKLITPMEVGSNRNNIIIKVITKPFAIKQYQQKLSSFSKEYRAYLDGSNGVDTNLVYVLNGKLFEQRDSISKKIYEIPLKKIKAVNYLSKSADSSLPLIRSVVVITTK